MDWNKATTHKLGGSKKMNDQYQTTEEYNAAYNERNERNKSKFIFDLDFYKAHGTPYYFGLGFIQIKINKDERFHFYHPELMPILDEEEIHDHRYEFTSTCLKGSLENELFTYENVSRNDAEYGLYFVSCSMEDAGQEPLLATHVKPIHMATFTVSEHQHYHLTDAVFHRIAYKEPTITHLYRGATTKKLARVIKPLEAPSVCPFSKKIEESECWEIIEKIINS